MPLLSHLCSLRGVGHADPFPLRPYGHLPAFVNPQDVCGSTTPLGKGTRCASPLHPPGHGSSRALNPTRASRPYRRSIPRRETSLSLHPSTWCGVPAPKTPDHDMEATDMETNALRGPWMLRHLDRRSDHSQGSIAPWNPDQEENFALPPWTSHRPTLRGLDLRQRIDAGPDSRVLPCG